MLPGTRAPIARLLVLLVAWAAVVEGAAAYGLHRASRIERRVAMEYDAARRPPVPPRPRPEILFVGNSLLLSGLDLAFMRDAAPAGWTIKRFAVESTTFFDWYFGLRRLFNEGARPAIVVVMLHWRQLATDAVRGEYFARHLMDSRDFLHVVRTLKLHPTPASNLLIGRLSAYYGTRVEIRKVLLGRLVKGAPALTALIQPAQPPAAHRIDDVAGLRLETLDRLCARYGARLVFVIPPTSGETYGRTIRTLAEARLVIVLLPPEGGVILEKDFADGFHLTEAGARKYTQVFARQFMELLTPQLGSPASAEPKD